MKFGNITCSKCGYDFYFETEMESVRCLQCGEKFDTMSFPDRVEVSNVLETSPGKVTTWDIDEGVLL